LLPPKTHHPINITPTNLKPMVTPASLPFSFDLVTAVRLAPAPAEPLAVRYHQRYPSFLHLQFRQQKKNYPLSNNYAQSMTMTPILCDDCNSVESGGRVVIGGQSTTTGTPPTTTTFTNAFPTSVAQVCLPSTHTFLLLSLICSCAHMLVVMYGCCDW
jgi:hypothetical protein